LYVGYFSEDKIWCSPVFPHEQWNVSKRILQEYPRTNNSVEGWHRAFNVSIEVANPKIARIIHKMKCE
jgi:hypothetical protein